MSGDPINPPEPGRSSDRMHLLGEGDSPDVSPHRLYIVRAGDRVHRAWLDGRPLALDAEHGLTLQTTRDVVPFDRMTAHLRLREIDRELETATDPRSLLEEKQRIASGIRADTFGYWTRESVTIDLRLRLARFEIVDITHDTDGRQIEPTEPTEHAQESQPGPDPADAIRSLEATIKAGLHEIRDAIDGMAGPER